jgi:hypothetical protein
MGFSFGRNDTDRARKVAPYSCPGCRLWVKDGRGRQADATAGLPPAPEIPVRSGTYALCQQETLIFPVPPLV